MARMGSIIGYARRLRRWAAGTFLRPASVTLVSQPPASIPADPAG